MEFMEPPRNPLTRRGLLTLTGAAAAGVVLSSCTAAPTTTAPQSAPPTPTPTGAPATSAVTGTAAATVCSAPPSICHTKGDSDRGVLSRASELLLRRAVTRCRLLQVHRYHCGWDLTHSHSRWNAHRHRTRDRK